MGMGNENRAVGQIAELLALARGYPPAMARLIRNAAALHDIGKAKIPESILNKQGRLSEGEFEVMKTHTKLGAAMMANMLGELKEMATLVCLYHHEHWDGNGYWGVPAYFLPEYVSIASIADVYAALRAKRVYKEAYTPGQALRCIQRRAGRQFAPVLVEVFTNMVKNDSRVAAIKI